MQYPTHGTISLVQPESKKRFKKSPELQVEPSRDIYYDSQRYLISKNERFERSAEFAVETSTDIYDASERNLFVKAAWNLLVEEDKRMKRSSKFEAETSKDIYNASERNVFDKDSRIKRRAPRQYYVDVSDDFNWNFRADRNLNKYISGLGVSSRIRKSVNTDEVFGKIEDVSIIPIIDI